MKILFNFIVLVLIFSSFCFSYANESSKEAPGEIFFFKYEIGKTLSYLTDFKIDMDMEIKSGNENINIKMIMETRYLIGLTPLANLKDEITTMRLEPSSIEANWDIKSPVGHIILSLKGSEMKGTKDGKIFIDTVKGLGTYEAKEFKKEILPLYLSGEVDLDKRGNTIKFRGDVPFVEFWNEISAQEVGFFGIVFPEHKVLVGESWNEKLTLKKIGDVRLGEKGLECNTKFTRLMDEVINEKRFAVFEISSPFIHKDLVGFFDQGGSTLKLNISKFERSATGKIKFAPEMGILTECKTKAKAMALMNSLLEGQNLNMKLVLNADMSLELISVDSKSSK